VLRNLFAKKDEERREPPTKLTGPRVPRRSSAWNALRQQLITDEGLRVLDVGPTSPTNINYLTSIGHGVWMTDLVGEALRGDWSLPPDKPEEEERFNTQAFFAQNMDFGGRLFDVVLLWATLDYIPEGLVKPLITQLHHAMVPGGKLLGIFHSKTTGVDTTYCRYHLTEGEAIEMQETDRFPLQRVYTNRNIEKIFGAYNNTRFFLAKDNLYEVLITR
jgi:hypothetical protein